MNAPLLPAVVVADTGVSAEIGDRVGGKALALARLQRAGLRVPAFAAVTTDAYHAFLEAAHLRERILVELDRKAFEDMRWEEIWDVALRVRNLFLTTPLPKDLGAALAEGLAPRFSDVATVVRSSAPGEDSAAASFAGLHESYVNVRGLPQILEHVKLVWASLWSDGALLYRHELGLDPGRSSMAVVVQEIVEGERSGVAFSMAPDAREHAIVEAVHGLNQGLVDGSVEPDRWTLVRRDASLLEHRPAVRLDAVVAAPEGVRLTPLPAETRGRAPLADDEVPRVHALARDAEERFGAPQDVEWTMRRDELFALQARPITTLGGGAGPGSAGSGNAEDSGDGRAAYLSLTRTFDSLQRLRRSIEDDALPEMTRQADAFAAVDVTALDDPGLQAELGRRKQAHDHWVDVYTRDFIPFAHGARLFGQAYNDTLHPADPYEFADVLAATPLLSTRRNEALEALADAVRAGGEAALRAGLERFAEDFDAGGSGGEDLSPAELESLVRRLAARPPAHAAGADAPALARRAEELAGRFVASHPADSRDHARELLELGRASWRLRDDDNAYLDRIEDALGVALAEAARRGLPVAGLEPRRVSLPSPLAPPGAAAPAVAKEGEGEEGSPGTTAGGAKGAGLPSLTGPNRTQARQIVGQPAGPGLGAGTARVVAGRDDLLAFAPGEILVCDAIEPSMTFIVPLAAGIVERRGGMLIHGAIIAREYGLPCVTGVPGATALIHSGDRVTVDGYLGIVTVG
jgi:pyruvate,water dikinase